jgi:hypothetical protein
MPFHKYEGEEFQILYDWASRLSHVIGGKRRRSGSIVQNLMRASFGKLSQSFTEQCEY